MVFNGTALPVILEIGFRSHSNLSGHKTNHHPRHVVFVDGKACLDPGKWKKLNEDSVFAVRCTWGIYTSPLSFGLFVVADGMGAYADGQDANCGAIQAMVDCIMPAIVKGNALRAGSCTALLENAIQRANEVVYQQNINLQSGEGTALSCPSG